MRSSAKPSAVSLVPICRISRRAYAAACASAQPLRPTTRQPTGSAPTVPKHRALAKCAAHSASPQGAARRGPGPSRWRFSAYVDPPAEVGAWFSWGVYRRAIRFPNGDGFVLQVREPSDRQSTAAPVHEAMNLHRCERRVGEAVATASRERWTAQSTSAPPPAGNLGLAANRDA